MATTRSKVPHLTRAQQIAHLSIYGWEPVIAATGAIVRGHTRIYVVARVDGLSVGLYEHSRELPRSRTEWRHMKTAHIDMLYERACRYDKGEST